MRMKENRRDRRLRDETKLINGSPVTLNVADVAKIMKISKPQAASDVDELLSEGKLHRHRIRRGWKLEEMLFGRTR